MPLVEYYKAWDKVDIEDELKEADKTKETQPNVTLTSVKEIFEQNKGKDKPKNIGLQIVGGTNRSLTSLE